MNNWPETWIEKIVSRLVCRGGAICFELIRCLRQQFDGTDTGEQYVLGGLRTVLFVSRVKAIFVFYVRCNFICRNKQNRSLFPLYERLHRAHIVKMLTQAFD